MLTVRSISKRAGSVKCRNRSSISWLVLFRACVNTRSFLLNCNGGCLVKFFGLDPVGIYYWGLGSLGLGHRAGRYRNIGISRLLPRCSEAPIKFIELLSYNSNHLHRHTTSKEVTQYSLRLPSVPPVEFSKHKMQVIEAVWYRVQEGTIAACLTVFAYLCRW
jgi:hypothetical protein